MSKLYKETPITLYHYSVERYTELSSLAARGLQKEGFESKESDPFAYNKSISFSLNLFLWTYLRSYTTSITSGRHRLK